MYPYFKDINSMMTTNFWSSLPDIEKEILKRYMVISANNRIVVATRSSFNIDDDDEFYHSEVNYKLNNNHILPLDEQHEILIDFFVNVAEGEDVVKGDNYTFKFDDNSIWVCDVIKI